jgi:hypothetical protein
MLKFAFKDVSTKTVNLPTQRRIQGGLWGLHPPRRISQAHILTYAFQG